MAVNGGNYSTIVRGWKGRLAESVRGWGNRPAYSLPRVITFKLGHNSLVFIRGVSCVASLTKRLIDLC